MDLDLSALASSIAEVFGPVAEGVDQTLTADLAPGLRLDGDRDLLTRMLANLIENANGVAVSLSDAGPGLRVTLRGPTRPPAKVRREHAP